MHAVDKVEIVVVSWYLNNKIKKSKLKVMMMHVAGVQCAENSKLRLVTSARRDAHSVISITGCRAHIRSMPIHFTVRDILYTEFNLSAPKPLAIHQV